MAFPRNRAGDTDSRASNLLKEGPQEIVVGEGYRIGLETPGKCVVSEGLASA